jgi:hypothetical protein
VGTELVGNFGAVDDERRLILVLHLDELADDRVDQAERTQQVCRCPADFAPGLSSGTVGDVDELAGGVSFPAVRQVPYLAGGVRVLAEHGEAFADVG